MLSRRFAQRKRWINQKRSADLFCLSVSVLPLRHCLVHTFLDVLFMPFDHLLDAFWMPFGRLLDAFWLAFGCLLDFGMPLGSIFANL